MSGPSLEPRIGSTYGISRTKTGKGAIGTTAGNIPGLDLVKQAGAKIVDYVGFTAQEIAGVDPDDQVSVTKTVADFLDPSVARGQKIAKDIRS